MAWTPDINTYFRVATGYKAGGSELRAGPIGAFGQTFLSGECHHLRAGTQVVLVRAQAAGTNVAVFHSEFSDMQLQFDVVPRILAIVQSYNAGLGHGQWRGVRIPLCADQ